MFYIVMFLAKMHAFGKQVEVEQWNKEIWIIPHELCEGLKMDVFFIRVLLLLNMVTNDLYS